MDYRLVVLTLTLFVCVSGQKCMRPDGKRGMCVKYTYCPEIVEKIRSPNPPNLQSYTCGYSSDNTPMVCCDDCYTPEGKLGKCRHINSCPHLLAMSKRTTEYNILAYVRNSRCETGSRDVCCGPAPITRKSLPDCKSETTAFPPDNTTECCGYDVKADSKITGGTRTGIDEYPWTVLLEYEKKDYLGNTVIKTYCGGSLISNRYVLTAAHCITGEGAWPPINVRLGEYDTRTETDCVDFDCAWPTQVIPIEEYIIHPEFNITGQRHNDIAIIRMARPANITDFVRPICLPNFNISERTQYPKVIAAGWGRVNETHRSPIKQHVVLPLLSTQDCRQSYNSRMGVFAPDIWEKQLCAGGEQGKDACKGDSGGPLMMKTGLLHELLGVVSYGPNQCGTEGLPGIYTHVYPYTIWIRRNIRP